MDARSGSRFRRRVPAAARQRRDRCLPDLRLALEEYGQRVLPLQQACNAYGLRCLFVTQPSMWRNDLSESERALLWFGRVGRKQQPKGYISVADAARAIEAYNSKLLEVCREHALECFDLAPLVPKDPSAFYDDFHFNRAGARVAAQLLIDCLVSTPPLQQQAITPLERKPSN